MSSTTADCCAPSTAFGAIRRYEGDSVVLGGLVSGERLAALVDGASLSAEELPLWQRAAAEHILSGIGELNWDRYSGWAVHRVSHSDGREAYLADVGAVSLAVKRGFAAGG